MTSLVVLLFALCAVRESTGFIEGFGGFGGPTSKKCSGVTYDPSTQECCKNTIIVKRGMCRVALCEGNVKYYPDIEHCCGSKPKPKSESCEKCKDKYFNPINEKCCNGDTIVNRIFNCDVVRYCNGKGYVYGFLVCCRGRIVNSRECKKCGKEDYLPSLDVCCREDEKVYCKKDGMSAKCTCGTKSYDPKLKECCHFAVTDIEKCEVKFCPYSNKKYFPRYEKCCSLEVRNKFFECSLCNGEHVKSGLEECCNGVIVNKGMCAKCGMNYYNKDKEQCCGKPPFAIPARKDVPCAADVKPLLNSDDFGYIAGP